MSGANTSNIIKFKINSPSEFRRFQERFLEVGFVWAGPNGCRYPTNEEGSLNVHLTGAVRGIIAWTTPGAPRLTMRPVFRTEAFNEFRCPATTTPVRWLKARGIAARVAPVFGESAWYLYEKQARETVGANKFKTDYTLGSDNPPIKDELTGKMKSFAKWKEEKLAKERQKQLKSRKKQKDVAKEAKTVEVTVKFTVTYQEV